MKKWYEKKRYILMLLLAFPPLGAFLLWRYRKWGSVMKWVILTYCGLWLIFSLASSSAASKRTQKAMTASQSPMPSTSVVVIETAKKEPTRAPTDQVESSPLLPSPTPEAIVLTTLEKIDEIVYQQVGSQATSIAFQGDEIAKDTDKPYEIIINFGFDNTLSLCFIAKDTSYELMKKLYSDQEIRENLQRVLITIPRFLRTSLGASSGIPMAKENVFSGPTNYWKVMSDFPENETGPLENRNWGTLMGDCAQ